jgi:hypothetical protein
LVSEIFFPLNDVRKHLELTGPEFLEALTSSIEKEASKEWKRKYLDGWRKIALSLTPCFDRDNVFATAKKSFELLGNRSALLLGARLLTDVRPLYDEATANIKGLILTNTFVLQFRQDGEQRVLHVTLDLEDLASLKGELERAEIKNGVLGRHAESWNVPLLSVSKRSES